MKKNKIEYTLWSRFTLVTLWPSCALCSSRTCSNLVGNDFIYSKIWSKMKVIFESYPAVQSVQYHLDPLRLPFLQCHQHHLIFEVRHQYFQFRRTLYPVRKRVHLVLLEGPWRQWVLGLRVLLLNLHCDQKKKVETRTLYEIFLWSPLLPGSPRTPLMPWVPGTPLSPGGPEAYRLLNRVNLMKSSCRIADRPFCPGWPDAPSAPGVPGIPSFPGSPVLPKPASTGELNECLWGWRNFRYLEDPWVP